MSGTFNWDKEHRERIPYKAGKARTASVGWRPSQAARRRAKLLRRSATGVLLRVPNKRVMV